MKKITMLFKQAILWLSSLTLLAMLLTAVPYAWAQDWKQGRQKTESPYFYMPGAQPGVDTLPLKQTVVDVKISGVIADVAVTQYYKNQGNKPIEAKYIFPGSTRAAVYKMDVHIGERVISANIREKQQARVEYETARSEGKTAALLEEHLPNVFQMNVANILPGDDIRVDLHYTELLVPQSGTYQFVFPTVLGPRYNSPNTTDSRSQSSAQAVSIPYLHKDEPNSAMFNLKTTIVSPIPIQSISSESHAILSQFENDKHLRATVNMEQGFQVSNRDFILNYSLAGDKVDSGIMLYKGEDENFFLAMVEPPKVVNKEIMPARDYIFVVDISGSMDGFPLDTAKVMLRELIADLRPNDTFNVLLFSGSSSTLAPQSVPATEANINQALKMLSTYYGSGNTELLPALRHVYKLPKNENLSRTVVILTDGYVSVEREAFELVRNNLDKANVFAFGIGPSVNRYLIEGLARAGQGEPFVITEPKYAKEAANQFRKMIASPALTNVSAKFAALDVYDVEPAKLPDVLGERPVIVYGKWKGEPKGSITIEGYNGDGAYKQVLLIDDNINQDTPALRHLWARKRIDSLLDQENLTGNHMFKDQITQLGLHYSLLTPYTSFVAVDHMVRNKNPGNTSSVTQPTPMPQGVSELAIGAEVPSTPEPAAWGAMALVAGMLAMAARHQRRRKNSLTS